MNAAMSASTPTTPPTVEPTDRRFAGFAAGAAAAGGGALVATCGAGAGSVDGACAVDGAGRLGTPSGRPAAVVDVLASAAGAGADWIVGGGGGAAGTVEPDVTASDDASGLSMSTENGADTSGMIARLSDLAGNALSANVTVFPLAATAPVMRVGWQSYAGALSAGWSSPADQAVPFVGQASSFTVPCDPEMSNLSCPKDACSANG